MGSQNPALPYNDLTSKKRGNHSRKQWFNWSLLALWLIGYHSFCTVSIFLFVALQKAPWKNTAVTLGNQQLSFSAFHVSPSAIWKWLLPNQLIGSPSSLFTLTSSGPARSWAVKDLFQHLLTEILLMGDDRYWAWDLLRVKQVFYH